MVAAGGKLEIYAVLIMEELPVELILRILRSTDPVDLFTMARTCSFFHKLLSHDSVVWSWVRQDRGLPDPEPIGITNRSMLASIYMRGCNLCKDHERIRTPRWEFGGIRLCGKCFDRVTVRDYYLCCSEEFVHYLPYVEVSGVCYGQRYHYKCYLWKHLLQTITKERRYEMQRQLLAMSSFKQKMYEYNEGTKRQKAQEDAVVKNERRLAINAFLQHSVPSLDPADYEQHPCYVAACGRLEPLTHRSATMLLSKLLPRWKSPVGETR